jgi:SAM-dependent methyltransferase
MALNDRSFRNQTRAQSFGAIAETYDRVRPGYPVELITELLSDQPATALDVGCGTGKVARLLAERGVAVLGVEVDERMAEVARGHAVDVEISGFEDWDDAGRRFDLITSGQTWHWLEPGAAARKAAAVLNPGGRLALFWNFVDFSPQVQKALDAAYAAFAATATVEAPGQKSVVRGGGPVTIAGHAADLDASGRFGPAEYRTFARRQDYDREQWLELIASHSDHSTLPSTELERLLAAVGGVIDDLGGRLPVTWTTYVILARPRP